MPDHETPSVQLLEDNPDTHSELTEIQSTREKSNGPEYIFQSVDDFISRVQTVECRPGDAQYDQAYKIWLEPTEDRDAAIEQAKRSAVNVESSKCWWLESSIREMLKEGTLTEQIVFRMNDATVPLYNFTDTPLNETEIEAINFSLTATYHVLGDKMTDDVKAIVFTPTCIIDPSRAEGEPFGYAMNSSKTAGLTSTTREPDGWHISSGWHNNQLARTVAHEIGHLIDPTSKNIALRDEWKRVGGWHYDEKSGKNKPNIGQPEVRAVTPEEDWAYSWERLLLQEGHEWDDSWKNSEDGWYPVPHRFDPERREFALKHAVDSPSMPLSEKDREFTTERRVSSDIQLPYVEPPEKVFYYKIVDPSNPFAM